MGSCRVGTKAAYYQYLTGLALQILKQGISGEDILAELLLALPSANKGENALRWVPERVGSVVRHPKRQYYFIPERQNRILVQRFPVYPFQTGCFLSEVADDMLLETCLFACR